MGKARTITATRGTVDRSPASWTAQVSARRDGRFLAPHVGRRAFVAGAAASGLAVLGLVKRAEAGNPYSVPYDVKQALQDIKDAACTVADYVEGLPGPLHGFGRRKWVEARITPAAMVGQNLLNTPSSLLYTTPEIWLYWLPVQTAGMNLTQIADTTCLEACEALEEWCDYVDNNTTDADLRAAMALWRTQSLYCHLFEAAGIE